MSPEALARLRNPRTAVRTGLADGEPPQTHAMVDPDDLRALLDAYDTAQAQAGMTSAVVSAVRITTDVTSLPHVNERVATLCAEYGVSTQQPPDRLIVELLNAANETAVVAMDDARKYLIERDAARAELSGVRMALQGASPATLSGLAIRVSYEIGARKAVLRDLQAVERERDTARAEGVAAERARVVAWLRAEAAMVGEAGGGERLRLLAFTFERVEHVPEGT